MTLILPKSRAVFLHIPKTGGTWVREALAYANVNYEIGSNGYHADHASCARLGPGPRFTVVRNPYRWYASFWSFRDAGGWGGDLAVGHPPCVSSSFEEFIDLVTTHHPSYLSKELFPRYVQPGTRVLRTRSVMEDLIQFLREVGEPFDETCIRKTPAVNVVGLSAAYLAKTQYTPRMAQRVYESEAEVFSRYDYDRDSYNDIPKLPEERNYGIV